MKISFALVITATLLLFQIPARAGTITQASNGVVCTMTLRQIPGQCGTVVPFYPRKLYVRSSRTPSYYYYPNYYCPY